MQEETVPKHSVRGYLHRRSTEELEWMLNYYLQEGVYENYSTVILEILAVLEERFVPDASSEWYTWAREKLLTYEPKKGLSQNAYVGNDLRVIPKNAK